MPIGRHDDARVVGHRQKLRAWLNAEVADLPAHLDNEPPDFETAIAEELELHRRLWEAGFGAAGWPETVGGAGGSAVLRAITYEELARAGLRVPQPAYTVETLCPALLRFAPDLAVEMLPFVLRGDEIWCQGFSEPEAGSDLASLRCSARPSSGGWTLHGDKIWTSFGHVSSRTALLARTGEPGHRGISLFLVDLPRAEATVEVRPIRASNGRNEFAELHFDAHPVDRSRLIGADNDGWGVAMYLLQWERGMYAWQRQALLHARLRTLLSVYRAAQRSSRVQAAVTHAWCLLTALRARSGATVRALANGYHVGPSASVDKVLLANAEQAVMAVHRMIDERVFALDGGHAADLLRSDWLYSRSASIYGGSIDIQRSIIAERVLALPRSVK